MVWEDGGREAPSYPIELSLSQARVGSGLNIETVLLAVGGAVGVPGGVGFLTFLAFQMTSLAAGTLGIGVDLRVLILGFDGSGRFIHGAHLPSRGGGLADFVPVTVLGSLACLVAGLERGGGDIGRYAGHAKRLSRDFPLIGYRPKGPESSSQ